MNYGVLSAIILIILLIMIFISYERRKTSLKEISLIATLSALAGIGRVPFAALPNVQPTTFLVIISGYVLGPRYGFVVGALATLVSNTFLGHGPWEPWQMIAWGLVGFSSGFIGKLRKNPSRLFLSIFAFCWGFAFDYMMNLWHWLFFIYPLNLKSFIAINVASFYFDLMHATGNFIFAFFFGKDFIHILSRFKKRLTFTEIKSKFKMNKEEKKGGFSLKKIIAFIMVILIFLPSITFGTNLESTAHYLEKQELDHWGILALYAYKDEPISRQLEKVDSELATDYEAYLLGATALGKNVLEVVEKITGLQRNSGKFSDYMDGTGEDMVNAHIWAIISLYAANYETYDQNKALEWLKENQNVDGGFSVYAGTGISDLDMSAMALIAYNILGLDYEDQEVKQTLSYLDSNISKKESCESYAWYILARVKFGLDIDKNLYDGLMKHQMQEGTFKHLVSLKKSNYMATWHGLMALTDYNNKISVFDKLHNESRFVDLGKTDYAYKEIMGLVKKGVISGYSDNTFRPNAPVKRGEFCKYLVYGSGLQNQIGEKADFEDLKGHWANRIVKVAVDKQWVQGMTSARFAPEDKIKGSEIAAMLVRVKGLEGKAAAIEGDNWYDGYVQIAKENDLLYSNFKPLGYATRAQCAEVVCKLVEN